MPRKSTRKGVKKRNPVNAVVSFDAEIAKTYHNVDYSKAEESRLNNLSDSEAEKAALRSGTKQRVSDMLDIYIAKAKNSEIRVFRILTSIRDRNVEAIRRGLPTPKHNNIISLVAHPAILLASYRTIRKNAGALTRSYPLPSIIFNRLSLAEQEFARSSFKFPDGMSYDFLLYVGKALISNRYIWGASRRIWIPKPGTSKERPITIPPFADKMVQEAIRMVLEAIYEPTFISMNCSFGFRASNSCHENIVSLTNTGHTQGFTIAIEGDIEEAYPKLDRTILLDILSLRISDQRFINMMRRRLDLILFDVKADKYVDSFLGIPQGGIDSPYLFNIYLLGMDVFIKDSLKNICLRENSLRGFSNIGSERNKTNSN